MSSRPRTLAEPAATSPELTLLLRADVAEAQPAGAAGGEPVPRTGVGSAGGHHGRAGPVARDSLASSP